MSGQRINRFGRMNESPPLRSYTNRAQILERLTVLYDKAFRIASYNKTLDPQTLDGKQHGIMADYGCKLGRDRMPDEVRATLKSTIVYLESRLLDLEDKTAA